MPYSGKETQTVTDDRAQVLSHPGKAGEDLEHRAIVSRYQSFQMVIGFLRRTTENFVAG